MTYSRVNIELRGQPGEPSVLPVPEASEVVAVPGSEQTPAPKYSESQLGFQRLLLRDKKGEAKQGDIAKRVGLNASIFAGATAVDIVESHLVDAIWRNPMDRMIEYAQGNISTDVAKTRAGVKLAGEFIEEWVSDSAYTSLANAWIRMMTGVSNATYVSETSAFIGDWVNAISQVFGGDKLYPSRFVHTSGELKGQPMRGFLGMKLAYQTMDFINPVNVEAAIRLTEEIPVLGTGISWLHDKADRFFASKKVGVANVAAAKGILGFHIGKNVKPL